MCYLVAKDRNAHGCFALKTTHGKHLVELKRELNREVGYKGVQLVTISRPTAYGEYAPYHFVDPVSAVKYPIFPRHCKYPADSSFPFLQSFWCSTESDFQWRKSVLR